MTPLELSPLERWRLVLGEAAEESCGGLDGSGASADAALSWLYGRGSGNRDRDVFDRKGGDGASAMTVPEWINEVHALFPAESIERLEKDAVERYQIHEVVTNAEVLARIEPNPTLLKAVLQTKHLMNPEVLELARKLVAKVVKQLMEDLAKEVREAFTGVRDRRRHTLIRYSRNFDAKRTLRENLRHIDPGTGKLVLRRPWFFGRTRNHSSRWQVIILVDQSGSMLDSTIHAAVTAACLWGMPSVSTHLIAFDTQVVDLTREVADPVELLMKVQLGGGTYIGQAVQYAAQLIQAPKRSIVVIISDFYEGGPQSLLTSQVASLVGQGTHVLGLCALDQNANAAYDRSMGQALAELGAHMGAMTPGELAGFIAEKVRG